MKNTRPSDFPITEDEELYDGAEARIPGQPIMIHVKPRPEFRQQPLITEIVGPGGTRTRRIQVLPNPADSLFPVYPPRQPDMVPRPPARTGLHLPDIKGNDATAGRTVVKPTPPTPAIIDKLTENNVPNYPPVKLPLMINKSRQQMPATEPYSGVHQVPQSIPREGPIKATEPYHGQQPIPREGPMQATAPYQGPQQIPREGPMRATAPYQGPQQIPREGSMRATSPYQGQQPIPREGPMRATAPCQAQQPMPREGSMHDTAPCQGQQPIPREGPMRATAPYRGQQPVPREGPMRATAPYQGPQQIPRESPMRVTAPYQGHQPIPREGQMRATAPYQGPQQIPREGSIPVTAAYKGQQPIPREDPMRATAPYQVPQQIPREGPMRATAPYQGQQQIPRSGPMHATAPYQCQQPIPREGSMRDTAPYQGQQPIPRESQMRATVPYQGQQPIPRNGPMHATAPYQGKQLIPREGSMRDTAPYQGQQPIHREGPMRATVPYKGQQPVPREVPMHATVSYQGQQPVPREGPMRAAAPYYRFNKGQQLIPREGPVHATAPYQGPEFIHREGPMRPTASQPIPREGPVRATEPFQASQPIPKEDRVRATEPREDPIRKSRRIVSPRPPKKPTSVRKRKPAVFIPLPDIPLESSPDISPREQGDTADMIPRAKSFLKKRFDRYRKNDDNDADEGGGDKNANDSARSDEIATKREGTIVVGFEDVHLSTSELSYVTTPSPVQASWQPASQAFQAPRLPGDGQDEDSADTTCELFFCRDTPSPEDIDIARREKAKKKVTFQETRPVESLTSDFDDSTCNMYFCRDMETPSPEERGIIKSEMTSTKNLTFEETGMKRQDLTPEMMFTLAEARFNAGINDGLQEFEDRRFREQCLRKDMIPHPPKPPHHLGPRIVAGPFTVEIGEDGTIKSHTAEPKKPQLPASLRKRRQPKYRKENN